MITVIRALNNIGISRSDLSEKRSNIKNILSKYSSRDDLSGHCGGAYDSKVGALSDWKDGKIKFRLISGPTFSEEEGIEPFSWSNASESCKNHNHYMIPEILKFDWIEYEPDFPF